MSSITLAELKAVRSKYATLPKDGRPEMSSGQCAHRDYTFSTAAKSSCYKITYMTDDEVMSTFKAIIDPKKKSMTENDLYKMVSIAMNIRHPVHDRTTIDIPWSESLMCDDFSSAKPSESSKVAMTIEDRPTLSTIVPGSQAAASAEKETEPVSLQAKAACFLFGWLTRYAVKSPSAALNIQYGKLKETFMKFYMDSSTVFEQFTPDSTWLTCLRNAFDAFVRVKNTMVLYVAAEETRTKSDPKMFNILRYLFFQNLEFMGMHAYVSIVTIMNKISLPPGLVLTWLRMSGCELAVDEAYMIISTLDNGMIANGEKAERLWKYARLLDAGYFNRLQTSYAAGLVATLSYIEIYMGISQETGYSSPLNIFAIANNKHIKETGKAKALAFMECKNSMISLSDDASVVDKLYAERTGKVHTDTADAMETEPDTAKRPAPDQAPESSKKRKTPTANIRPPPKFD